MEDNKWVVNKPRKFWSINVEVDESQKDINRSDMTYINKNENRVISRLYIDGSNKCRFEIDDKDQDILQEFNTMYGDNKFTSMRFENWTGLVIK